MSDMFDDKPRPRPQPQRPVRQGRSRALWITLGVVLALFLAFTLFASLWTERLWFKSTGYSSVFTQLIRTRIGLFLVFGAVMAIIVAVNLYLAYRFRPVFRPASPEQVSLDRYREAIRPIRVVLLVGISLVVGAFAGTSGSGKWREYMLWRNGGEFGGEPDPFFNKDIGFYVFDLPWYHFIVDFLMAAAVVALIVSAITHYVYGGIKLQSKVDRFSGAAAVQLSVLLGVFVLAKAVDYYLDRFDLLNEGGSLMTGIGYTDDNAVLPAKNILMFIALICAVLFFANVVRRTWLLPSVGLGLLVLSSILLGMIWPAVVQQFQVAPSQANKEEPYIQKNIDATRAAYDIQDVEIEDFAGATDLTSTQQNEEVRNIKEIRLLDPALVRATFEQLQQEKGYYSVADVLDVDRYEINGHKRDIVIGVRELNQDGLPDEAKNWNNLHTVYTHGYGVIAAFGNQRDINNETQSASDEPVWVEQSLPPRGELTNLFEGGYRGQIYFGEQSPTYSIVGKANPDDRDVELDIPDDSETGSAVNNTYDGAAGVPVGNLFNKVLYAWKFSEPNIVLSNRVNENSKILYDRDPRLMVEKVAPWLTVDADPYPAVVDGKIVWLLDGYTTTDRYPQAEKASFEDMTSDSLNDDNQFRTLPTDEINYMRNAVKAVVDAYDGTVTLYAWDESDPLLQAWRKAFPGTVKDRKDIPADLLAHMRYPEDLFKVQRYQLASYHVEQASTFYEGNARWAVPEDPNSPGLLQPAYRLSVRTPSGGDNPIFSLTSVYVPYERQNLKAFVAVDSDASLDSYGTIRVLELPGGQRVDGPGQAANRFGSNDEIQRQLEALTRNSNVRIINGNLLTLPVGESLLYVQPVYAVRQGASTANYPVLRQVLVSFGERTAIGQTVAEAVAKVLDVDISETPEAPEEPTEPGEPGEEPEGPTGTVQEQIRDLLIEADAKFKEADAALKDGDLSGYADRTGEAEQLVSQALALASEDSGEAPGTEEAPVEE
ncbi:UPF0182 family protein [Nocardioides sp. AE5]|uniref:UPF0182 family membrane protein n=1 Tax=Nocardioides sp. AE5 TaxID=2962573 RepID=UPI0028822609|nr:UPF0182 family protein [Nocardioides sp. AE5]MDT0203878.1 UPF0182 family protein [Nocardioides sp. AE5]